MKDAPAKRMKLPDSTDDMTDFDVDDIGNGVELESIDIPNPDDYLRDNARVNLPRGKKTPFDVPAIDDYISQPTISSITRVYSVLLPAFLLYKILQKCQ